jgi:hypothetical protein
MATAVGHHGKATVQITDISDSFQDHQISWVDYLAPATLVPIFAAHQFERAHSVGPYANPAVSAEINIFLRQFADENTPRNIMYRDQFPGVSRQIACSCSAVGRAA